MKTIILTLIALLGIATIASAKAPETLKLRVGQSKTADRGKVTVKFLSVVEDSRCPIGTNCIWAGNAKIKLAVSKGRSAAKTVEINSGLEPQSVTVYGYEIKFNTLTPSPGERGKLLARPKTATLSITKYKRQYQQ